MTISSGRNGKRTKTGCLTCRKRKKKCDEHHPICHGCSKNNIQCIWGQQRRKERLHRPQGYNKDFAVPQELSHCITIFAAPSMTLQQRMISHFANYCPIWISCIRVTEGSNFMASLMPIAMRNALVMECLLAVATGDIGKIAGESIEIGRLSAHHYARASAGLSVAITREMEAICDEEVLASDDNLVAVLLLCVHEAVNFTSPDRLLIHINGAILLISNRLKSPLPPKNPDLRGFLLEVFYYFFTMAASTHCSLIKSDDRFGYQVFHSPFLQSHHGRGMLLGAQSEVFHIILRLSLALNRYSQSASDNSSLQIELSSIQSDLLRIPIHAEPGPNSQSQDPSSLTELHITSKLYYLACQSLLYQLMYQDDAVRDDLIHETMRQFFDTLEHLPFLSPANGVLCWPLFIAGLSSRTGKCRSIVLSRLRIIETDWRSHVAQQASKQLTRIWKDTRQGVGVLMASNTYSNITKLPMILV